MRTLFDRGFLYIASGQKYVDEALKSAESLKKTNPNAHCTLAVTAGTSTSSLNDIFSAILQIDIVESLHEDWAVYLKPAYLFEIAPYNKTIFIDTDTFVCEDLSPLFTVLDTFDIAIAYSPFHNSVFEDAELSIFEEFNTGLIAFRKNIKVKNFMKCWKNDYSESLKHYKALSREERALKLNIDKYIADQPSFGRALYKSNLRLFTLTNLWNFRSHSPAVLYGSVKIIHYRRHTDITFQQKINEHVNKFRLWNPRSSSYIDNLYEPKRGSNE